MSLLHILTLVGARPQFIKAAVLSQYLRQLGDEAPIRETLVHSGQHYDAAMSQIFFDELAITTPKYNLDVGSASASIQIARIIERFDPLIAEEKPDGVLVYGDTNSTLAAAIVATRYDIPLIHVEAGERLFRRHNVPEESNRIVTDSLAALCLTASTGARSYLEREGYAPQRVHFVGDPMYDLFLFISQRIRAGQFQTKIPADFGLEAGGYILATMHRAENTRTLDQVRTLLTTLDHAPLPVILPLHPRVANMIKDWDWQPSHQLKLVDALGYPDLISLLLSSERVFTDSGGLQRETFFARKPAIVPLADTPWQNLVEAGWVHLVGNDVDAIHHALHHFQPLNDYPEGLFGDGHSSQRIVDTLVNHLPTRKEPAWHYRGSISDMPAQTPTTFTYGNYAKLLAHLKSQGYSSDTLTLYHPVVFDLAGAEKLASIERQQGFMATYFLNINGDSYNPLSSKNIQRIQRIIEAGHTLGIITDDDVHHVPEHLNLMETYFGMRITKTIHEAHDNALPRITTAAETPVESNAQQTVITDKHGVWNPVSPFEGIKTQALILIIHPVLWQAIPYAPTTALHHWLTNHTNQQNRTIDTWT